MNYYIICPVRRLTEERKPLIDSFVKGLENEGHKVFLPYRDVDQSFDISQIVKTEMEAIRNADAIYVFWDKYSYGGHFDLGVALALNKTVLMIKTYYSFDEDGYEKVIEEFEFKTIKEWANNVLDKQNENN